MPLLPQPINEKTGEPSWRWRRIMVFIVIVFCMWLLLSMVDKADTDLNQTIAKGAIWLIGILALIYAGFATVQDVAAIITARTGRPYADPPAPPTSDTVIVQVPPEE